MEPADPVNRYEKGAEACIWRSAEADKGQGLLCPDHQCGPTQFPAGGLQTSTAVLTPRGLWPVGSAPSPAIRRPNDNEETVRKMFGRTEGACGSPRSRCHAAPGAAVPMAMNLAVRRYLRPGCGLVCPPPGGTRTSLRRHRGRCGCCFLELGGRQHPGASSSIPSGR